MFMRPIRLCIARLGIAQRSFAQRVKMNYNGEPFKITSRTEGAKCTVHMACLGATFVILVRDKRMVRNN